jgi:hypothetical protein
MMEKLKNFEPIKLINTSVISRKGYYYANITNVDVKLHMGKQTLKVEFEVIKGKYQGFKVSAFFPGDFKSNVRLSFLCNAVGIMGELEAPEQLLGKIVKLRIVPYYSAYSGKKSLKHKITRFHPVNETQLKNLKG